MKGTLKFVLLKKNKNGKDLKQNYMIGELLLKTQVAVLLILELFLELYHVSY
jgi:hypothetical protein